MLVLTVTTLASGFASSGVHDRPKHRLVALAPVVVSATGTAEDILSVPAAVDVISADAIGRARARINLSESLQRIPGVIARDRQNFAQDQQISIRGFGARANFGVRGIRLYTDGIPASMPDGQGQVSHFALETADRIEVLRGPFSALYGNSSGGVIALFTRDAPDWPRLRGDFVAGSYGLRRSALSFLSPLDAHRDSSIVASLDYVDAPGFRRHSAAQRRDAQALVRGSFAGDGSYTLIFNSLALDADDPQGLSAADVSVDRRAANASALRFDTRKTVQQQQLGARIEQRLTANTTIALLAYAGQRATTQMLSVPVSAQTRNPLHGGGAIGLERIYSGVDVRFNWSGNCWGTPLSVSAGTERGVSREHRRGFENFVGARLGAFGALRRDEHDQVTGQDYYAQAQWQPSARWRVNTGWRRSSVSFTTRDHYVTARNPDDSGALSYAHTSPVLGLLYRATPTLSVYANAGKGFETPTFAELSYRDDGLSGLNTQLRPARSQNMEAGLRARDRRLAYSATVFQSRTRDELVVASSEGGRSVFRNAGWSRRRGLELAYSMRISPRWNLAAAYTYLEARYRSDVNACAAVACVQPMRLITRGNNIPGVARQFAWSELRWSPTAGFDLSVEARLVDRVYADDANSAAAPGYAALDLGAERQFDYAGLQWRAFARVNNLLDRQTVGSVVVNDSNGRYFEPAPGRNWIIGLSASRDFR